jgi:hypothetical protein
MAQPMLPAAITSGASVTFRPLGIARSSRNMEP